VWGLFRKAEQRPVPGKKGERKPCVAQRFYGISPWEIRVEKQAGERDGAVNGTHLGSQRRESPAAQGVLGFRKNNKNGA
jgi:hypothetical protein